MIIRSPQKESNFYVLDKSISEDIRLSWQARGLLVFLLGKPDNWKISAQHLVNQTQTAAKKTGRDGVYAILKELEDAGYVTREATRDDTGAFAGYDYHVSESPLTANTTPLPDLPETAQPDTANPTLIRTEYKQELIINNNQVSKPAKKEKVKVEYTIDDLVSVGIDSAVARDFLLIRKQKKAMLTETALKGIVREAQKAGYSLEQALSTCVERNWVGFNAEWVRSKQSGQFITYQELATGYKPEF